MSSYSCNGSSFFKRSTAITAIKTRMTKRRVQTKEFGLFSLEGISIPSSTEAMLAPKTSLSAVLLIGFTAVFEALRIGLVSIVEWTKAPVGVTRVTPPRASSRVRFFGKTAVLPERITHFSGIAKVWPNPSESFHPLMSIETEDEFFISIAPSE